MPSPDHAPAAAKQQAQPANMSGRKTNPASIKNKQKREEVYALQRLEKRKAKDERRKKRKREVEELGEDAPPKQVAKTLDNTREFDETIVRPDDREVRQTCSCIGILLNNVH